jgi:L-ascorbate metabolism protein UlaG (beta-lactamase superfamily)
MPTSSEHRALPRPNQLVSRLFLLLLVTAAPARAAVTLIYLGAAGWQISDGRQVLLVDPFFTRKHTGVPDEAAIDRYTPPRVDLILVEHSHADHLLDVPSIAKKRGAQVLGSESSIHVARAAGVPPQKLIPVGGGEDLELDGVSVRVIPGLHSRLDDGHYYAAHTSIPPNVKLPLREEDYVEGGTLNYLVRIGKKQILIISSANFVERELVGLRPDVVIVALGFRHKIHDYTCRLMRALGLPRLVLATHHDGTYGPMDAPMQISDEDKRFADEVHACSAPSTVILPARFQSFQQ